MKRVPLLRFAGALLVLLGGAVMVGWWLRFSFLVRVLPEFTPMVFSTALCFVLAGGALLTPFSNARWHRRVTTVIGGALAAISALVLAEHLFQSDLGVDGASLHAWLPSSSPKPGRMSAGTASGFLMSAAVLILATRVRRPWMGAAVQMLTLGIGVIGVLGLAGYFLSAELLFPGYLFAGVAVHTAAGLVLLAVGLRSAWKRFEWARTPLLAREDDRITVAGATILVAIALAAGIASFAILQGRAQTLVGDSVLEALTRRTDMFRDLIQLREVNARIAATRPAVLRNLRVIRAGRDDGSNIANVRAVVDSFVKEGFSGLAYYDVDGEVVSSGGVTVQAPAMTVTLATPAKPELLWDEGFLLRHRIPLRDAIGEVGTVLTEQPLPVLTRLAQSVSRMGATGDMGLCVLRGEQLDCFPQRLNPRAFSIPLVNVAGDLLPMTRALRGETGVVITRDYRAQNVVAAYGPVGDLGLGMVVKIDAAEIFQPIREQLQIVVVLLLLLVAGGTVLLRSQVKPLAADLRESREQFRAVTETASDAIISADGQGKIIYFNRAAERILGYSAKEALGQPLTLLMPERFQGPHRRGFERFLATGQAQIIGKTLELVARNKDGTEFPIEISVAHWTTTKGSFFTAILRDITARKEAEGILTRRTAELEAANRELEAFSYSVSHDLRAPLRHIDGFSDMLREECGPALDDSGRRYLGVISESVKQMGRLIDDLLVFSKMGRVEMRQTQISMDDLVKEVLGELAGETDGRNIEWEIQSLPVVLGDGSMMKQVWTNLLSNSVKYTRPRDLAKIKIGCTQNNGQLEFYVQDNGVGFDMKYVEKLFGVFQRLHRAEEFEGTGVGLANVRRIVSRHGGRTRAQGRVDEGATFYFSLPDSAAG
ncbi:MAG TPA: PAS domain S-box protein [Burkholderiales bacterium]|nr:PAS domain S-box protein [Burkholderiales bacterium]